MASMADTSNDIPGTARLNSRPTAPDTAPQIPDVAALTVCFFEFLRKTMLHNLNNYVPKSQVPTFVNFQSSLKLHPTGVSST